MTDTMIVPYWEFPRPRRGLGDDRGGICIARQESDVPAVVRPYAIRRCIPVPVIIALQKDFDILAWVNFWRRR